MTIEFSQPFLALALIGPMFEKWPCVGSLNALTADGIKQHFAKMFCEPLKRKKSVMSEQKLQPRPANVNVTINVTINVTLYVTFRPTTTLRPPIDETRQDRTGTGQGQDRDIIMLRCPPMWFLTIRSITFAALQEYVQKSPTIG